MTKYLVLTVTFVAVTGVGFRFRQAFYGPATASSRNQGPRPEPLTPRSNRPISLDAAAPPKEGVRFAAGQAPADSADLLLARIAYDSGSYLLKRARATPGSARLLQQAAQHFRACLSHEDDAPENAILFGEARHDLAVAERLLAEAQRPAAPAPVRAAPQPAPEPPPALPVTVPRQAEKMVGPDGVIYQRENISPR
jgi:hypothetical protein